MWLWTTAARELLPATLALHALQGTYIWTKASTGNSPEPGSFHTLNREAVSDYL